MSKKRISKRTREEAASLCSAWASNWGSSLVIADSMGAPFQSEPDQLACMAWASLHEYDGDSPERNAEAEALLRTGWVP